MSWNKNINPLELPNISTFDHIKKISRLIQTKKKTNIFYNIDEGRVRKMIKNNNWKKIKRIRSRRCSYKF